MNDSGTWWIDALLSALFAALTTIFAKIGVATIDSNLATAIRTLIILPMVWGIVLFEGHVKDLAAISYKTLIFLILSGVATGLSWLFYFQALQKGNASLVAPIDKSSLALVLLFSALFLGEPLTGRSILGVALIVGGTLVIIL
jgi:bacterial/archaeal transporter family protein